MMINMSGMAWEKAEGGIYLMGHDTSQAQVARGGGGLLRSQKVRGWDGGAFIPGDVRTTEEALALTKLDWLVDKHPILKLDPVWGVNATGEPGVIGWQPREGAAPVAGKREQENSLETGGFDIVRAYTMNVRRDTGDVLGIVGPGWDGPQNHESFSFVDDLVDSGDAKWLAGGMIGNGEKIWMCAQLDRGVCLGGDVNEMSIPLMFLSNGWDGYMSLTVTCAPYRLACWNGQSIPLEGFVRTWRGRHTRSLTAAGRLQVARNTLELSIGYFDAWAEEMETLMTKPMSGFRVEATINRLFPDAEADGNGETRKRAQANVEKAREALLGVYRHTDNLQHLGHTEYRFMNAVTDYADWHVKCPTDRQVLRSAEASKLKDRAYKLLVSA